MSDKFEKALDELLEAVRATINGEDDWGTLARRLAAARSKVLRERAKRGDGR